MGNVGLFLFVYKIYYIDIFKRNNYFWFKAQLKVNSTFTNKMVVSYAINSYFRLSAVMYTGLRRGSSEYVTVPTRLHGDVTPVCRSDVIAPFRWPNRVNPVGRLGKDDRAPRTDSAVLKVFL